MVKNFYLKAVMLSAFLLGGLTIQAAPPTQPSRDLTFSHQDGHMFSVRFTKGNGTRRIVIARLAHPVTSVPQNGNDYNHNEIFGKGDELNTGEFVVYDGEQAGFFINGLAPASRYFFAVFEYNGTGFSTAYLTQQFAVGNFATLDPPAVQVSGLTTSEPNGNSVKINWVNGSGSRRLVVMREGAPIQVNPQDLTNYNGRPDYGNGTQLAAGTFAVAFTNQQSMQSITVTDLQPATTYYIKAFEAAGGNGPVFQPAGAPEISFTTLAHPTDPAKDLVATTPEGNVVSIAWKNGNGSRRLVVVREGQPHTALPTDGTDYAGIDNFSTAPEMAPGHKVIYHTNGFQWLNMRGAKPGTTYYFKIYESSGTGNRTTYRLADAPAGAFATWSAPSQGPSNVSFSQANPGSVTVGYAPGNGTGRMVIARANEPVNAVPEDLVNYNGNAAFGSGQNIANGNFVLNAGANTQTVVTALTPGTTYHYAVFEYNGNQARVYNNIPARGSFTQSNRPTQQASRPQFSLLNITQFRLGWTSGNGQRRLVLLRKGAPVTMNPADGTDYPAQSNAGMAADVGEGHKAVYFGSSNFADISGLEPGTTYYIKIFEAAGNGTLVQYLTSNAPEAQVTTVGTPTEGPKSFTMIEASPTQAKLSILPGNGVGTIWVMRESLPVTLLPQDLRPYNSSARFGSSNTGLGEGHFIVHLSGNTENTITELKPGTTYHIAAFSYNGGSVNVYNREKALYYSFTTPFRPAIPSAAPTFPIIDAGSMRVTWATGNGNGRIVIARAGQPVNAWPADGEVYNTNLSFNQAPEILPGQRVVYDGSSGIADITGLSFGTTYHFAIFEYTRVGDRIEYQEVSPAVGSSATLPAPTVQTTAGRVFGIGATTATIGWTNGNGNNRMVVLRKGEPVAFVPEMYRRYGHSPAFSSASQQSDGSRIVGLTNGTQWDVSSLQPGTTYHGAIYEYNGSATPAYLKDVPATFSFTTIGAPTESATQLLADQQQNTSLRLSWHPGSGQRRLVVMRAGAPVNGVPENNQRYQGNSFFGSGAILPNGHTNEGSPNYVVYHGTGEEVIVTNLLPSVMYHVAVIEFNDFGTSVMYQQPAYLRGTFSAATPLPLTLGDFKAQQHQTDVLLEWHTLEEQNTAYFGVEVQQEGGAFTQIATVAAAGNSSRPKHYQYHHYRPGSGNFQYRLRMTDKDGTFTYSPIARVFIKGNTQNRWYVRGGYLYLELGYTPLPGTRVEVYTMNGSKITEQKLTDRAIKIFVGNQPKGMYIVSVTEKAGHLNFKVLL
jgi:hypothetical protein